MSLPAAPSNAPKTAAAAAGVPLPAFRAPSSSALSQQGGSGGGGGGRDSLGPTARDYWLPDGIARSCASCRRRFTSFRRKHHCRRCGNVFCRQCAAQYRVLEAYLSPVGGVVQNCDEVAQRLCRSCCQRFDAAVAAGPMGQPTPQQPQQTQQTQQPQKPAAAAGRNSDLF